MAHTITKKTCPCRRIRHYYQEEIDMRPYTQIARRSLIALLLTGAVLLPAQGKHLAQATTAPSPYGGTLVDSISQDPQTLDPAISYGWTDYNMVHNVFNALL